MSKKWRTNKDGKLIHDADCWIYAAEICTCGLVHYFMPLNEKEQEKYSGNYYKDCGIMGDWLWRLQDIQRKAEPDNQEALEMKRLKLGLTKIMKKEYVEKWLITENKAFNGLTPFQIVANGQIDRIWRMIYELESGIPN